MIAEFKSDPPTFEIGIEAAKKSLANFQSWSDFGSLTPDFIFGIEVKSI